MFDTPSTIISSELSPAPANPLKNFSSPPSGGGPFRKAIIGAAIAIGVLVLAAGIFWAVKKYWPTKNTTPQNPIEIVVTATGTPGNLPTIIDPTAASTSSSTILTDAQIEKLSFADYYLAGDNTLAPKLAEYTLPLNSKLDVINYYDVARKINLDPALESLNQNGFAFITNPWSKDTQDFYTIYGNLSQKQVPLLITSDFLIYYYQNILKKSFQDIEENVFYDNLWSINKSLYSAAKNRYEARLAAIGNINDSVLEGERLEMAFFAVALELLKPAANQIAPKGDLSDNNKFVMSEVERFYFISPPYLRDDVAREVSLIRAGRDKVKSPVMLYNRDYSEFYVPTDYRSKAKLNNFYLTTKWLRSAFPLNYRDQNCADCLLDKEDWRLNMITASLIAQDFANSSELKGQWARIYKVMYFFQGLREDLNYIHYRDAIAELFGIDARVEDLFDDGNKDAAANLEKLRARLLANNFSAAQGALNKNDAADKKRVGFKMLAESYWPNEYIFASLVSPSAGRYQGASMKNNVTYCPKNPAERCNGFALDPVALVFPVANNNYYEINTNYSGYAGALDNLRGQLDKNAVWHTTNYWSNLSLVKSFLEVQKSQLPTYSRSTAWHDQALRTAAAAWVNLQLPLEKFSFNKIFKGQGLNNTSSLGDNYYIEPNLNLVNEMLANNNMVLQMFSALKIDQEVKVAAQNIQTSSANLEAIRRIIAKEIQGEELSLEDSEMIADFSQQLKVQPAGKSDKQLVVGAKKQTAIREDLSRLKLLVIVHQEGEKKSFSVGPVWDYQEYR